MGLDMYFEGTFSTQEVKIMSHPVNDEILENLYEEVKEEFPNAL